MSASFSGRHLESTDEGPPGTQGKPLEMARESPWIQKAARGASRKGLRQATLRQGGGKTHRAPAVLDVTFATGAWQAPRGIPDCLRESSQGGEDGCRMSSWLKILRQTRLRTVGERFQLDAREPAHSQSPASFSDAAETP